MAVKEQSFSGVLLDGLRHSSCKWLVQVRALPAQHLAWLEWTGMTWVGLAICNNGLPLTEWKFVQNAGL